jgi:glycine cleavage system H protein
MKTIEGLYYSKDHEWVKVDGDKVYIGISDYAQHSLGDIVFVELPELDEEYEQDDVLGVVESVKAASDIFTPVSCRVVEVNEALEDTPELLNQAPYENYIAVVELLDESELEGLMNYSEYESYCKEE